MNICLVFQAAISFVLASMCSSNLLSGEVKLKVGNSDSDCRICFQPILPNYCKGKHPENSKPFFFIQSISPKVQISRSLLLAKQRVLSQIKYADCAMIVSWCSQIKHAYSQNPKAQTAATFLWVLQLPNLDRIMSRLGDWPLPNTSKYNTNKLLPNTPTTSLQECVFPAFKLTVPKAYLMLAMLGYVESRLLTVELCRHKDLSTSLSLKISKAGNFRLKHFA